MGSLAMSHSAALTPMPGHDLTKIFDRDLVSVAEHFDALVAGDVDQRTDVVNPELRKPGTGRVLGDLEAIVPAVLVGLGRKAFELRASLPDLGTDDLRIAAAPAAESRHAGAL